MKHPALLLLVAVGVIGCDREATNAPTRDKQAQSTSSSPATTQTVTSAASAPATRQARNDDLVIRRDGVGLPVPPPGYKLHTMAPAMGLMLPEGWAVEAGKWREADRTTPLTVSRGDILVIFLAAPESTRYPEPPDALSQGLDNIVSREGRMTDAPHFSYDRASVPKGVVIRGRLLVRNRIEFQAKRVWFWGAGPEAELLEIINAARRGLVVD